MRVPLFATSLEPYRDRIAERLAAVVDSGRYILGPEVEAFEREFASHLGARFCVGVASGTDALTIALRAMGVAPGAEVVVPSLTFYATAEAVVNAGATPVFCDIDPETYCVTPETVAAALTPATGAILPVHLFGNVAPVGDLASFGLPVLEDTAQAAGASLYGRRAGTLGAVGAFSFFPSKNLPCLGDGGALVTGDEELAARAHRLRFHGSDDKVTHTEVGYNSRLDALQAAVLRLLLGELDSWSAARRAVARAYERHGLGELVGLPASIEGGEHAFHQYVVRHPRADELAAALGRRGIGARPYYRRPVHRQPAMAPYARDTSLRATDEVARTNLALPMGPALSEDAVAEVVAACAEALS